MKKAESVLVLKFKSSLDQDELLAVSHEDLETFRNVQGLIQKYYVVEESTGALSGIYIFETEEDRTNFWTSELATTIPARYGVLQSTLRVEKYEMAIVLNDLVVAK
jgi:hypothetical protein